MIGITVKLREIRWNYGVLYSEYGICIKDIVSRIPLAMLEFDLTWAVEIKR